MSEDAFQRRRLALEDEFFRAHDRELVAALREEHRRQDATVALRDATGIANTHVLDELLKLDIDVTALTALSLVPLIAVAWADGQLEHGERTAVLRTATTLGVESGSLSATLLDSWLLTPPEPALLEAWAAYVDEVAARLSPEARATLREETLTRCRKVAEAAGGIVSTGPRVSREEHSVLAFVEATLGGSV